MYKFKDLSIGQEEVFCYEVTEQKLDLFRELSGDVNPLHRDEIFAKDHGYRGKVAYGMLSASLISTLGGVYLPGKYCLIQQIESKFLFPVYIGDRLEVKGKIKELNDSVRQAVIKVEIRNQEDKKVVRATLRVGFLE